MSISEIQRFSADLKSDPALRAEVEAYGAAQARSQEDLVKFAAAKGYDFDAQELAQVATEVRGREMCDADLEGVSGGGAELKPGEWAPGVAQWVAALVFWPFLPKEPGH